MSFLVQTLQHLLLTWVVLYLLFMGTGLLIRRALHFHAESAHHIFSAFWIGFGGTIAFLQIWHLFFPVNILPFMAITFTGIVGLLIERKPIWERLRQWHRYWLLVPLFVFLVLLIANQASNQPVNYDDGLYHLQDLRWAQNYPIVPGLGNLHGRFAFNNALTLPWAMIDSVPWFPPVQHVGGGLLALALMIPMLWSGLQVVKYRSADFIANLDLLLLGPVIFIGYIGLGYSSLKNDYPLFLVGLVTARYLLNLLIHPPVKTHQKRCAAFSMALLVSTGVSIKMSFAVQGLLTLVIALGILSALPARAKLKQWLMTGMLISAVCLAVIIPWIYRGVILSGYPLYPEPTLGVNVDWKIPQERVMRERDWVRSWARQPHERPEVVLADWNWLPTWLQNQRSSDMTLIVPLLIGSLTLAAYAVHVLRHRAWNTLRHRLWLWFLPIVAALIFWFLSAPAPRFGWHLFWLWGSGLLIVTIHVTGAYQRRRDVVLLMALLLMAYSLLRLNWVIRSGEGIFRPIPAVELDVFVTDHGLEVLVPSIPDQCYDAPLPCAPGGNRSLRLRDPQDMGKGFVLDTSQR